ESQRRQTGSRKCPDHVGHALRVEFTKSTESLGSDRLEERRRRDTGGGKGPNRVHEKPEQSIAAVLDLIKNIPFPNLKIVVTNPTPIQWGGTEDKTDQQLLVQAKALNQLGRELRKLGLKLAYHNHDTEMRQSARELHHMMLGTDPENVHLCFDAHWMYRGAGNSQIAMFDIFRLYHQRIVELHVRNSVNGIWQEVFGPGDIDYEKLIENCLSVGLQPHLVLEQAVEKDSPHQFDTLTAQQKNFDAFRKLFAEPFSK
ncbi:MAG: sugar phosphate isomerase/epimerase, partial [Bacteroidota bacterium]